MKYFKMIFAAVSLLLFTNFVIAENQRIIANPDVNPEVRSSEDKVKDSSVFTSINPGDNSVKMSSFSSREKNKNIAVQAVGVQATKVVQLQTNNKDIVKKYNRFSDKHGEKKNK